MKANKFELEAALHSSMLSSLEQDSIDADNMKKVLEEFNTKSQSGETALSGDNWDSIRNKLTEYNNVLTIRNTLASELASKIKGAIQSVYDCMGDYEELDYSELEEIKQTKQDLSYDIEYVSEHLNDTYTTKDGKKKNVYNVPEMTKTLALWREELRKANLLITKLEEFAGVYSQAEGTLTAASSKITEFGSKVAGLKVGKKYAYTRKTTA